MKLFLNFVEHLKDFAYESDALIGIADITEFVCLGITESFDYLVQAEDAHRAVLLVHLHCTILIVGQQTLFDVPVNNMPHGIKSFTAQKRTLFEKCKYFFSSHFCFQRNPHQVDGIDLDRTDREAPCRRWS